jgi:hypothetical protein
LGIDIGTTAIPYYQDLQFKLNFPFKNGDNLSVFGLGGYSYINFITSTRKKPEARDIYASKDQDEYFRAGLGMMGLTYTHRVNDKSYSKTSLAISTQYNRNHFDRIIRHVDTLTENFVLDSIYNKQDYFFVNTRYTISYMRNTKINTRSSIRYGIVTEMIQPLFIDSNLLEPRFNTGLQDFYWKKRLNIKHRYSSAVSTLFSVEAFYYEKSNHRHGAARAVFYT